MKTRPGEKVKLMSVDQLLGVPDTEGSSEIEVARIHAFKVSVSQSTPSQSPPVCAKIVYGGELPCLNKT